MAFAVLDAPGPVLSSELRRIWTAPEGFFHPRGWTNFGYSVPSEHPHSLLQARGFTAQTLSQGPCWPQLLLFRELCPAGHLSPVLATGPGHSCFSTILIITLVQD